ncbi:NAD-dependent epimerase/dehydratase family protein [Streptomyces sp. cg2]|uniref:NAD-dependent epimerase/dehydratase family protein n=1 Tax=Streptomyces sp. cg2 TaxID=3238799 RepID=UPI0034E27ECB
MQDPAPSRPPTAVVLGGTGCIGRHVCTAFARHGYRVVVVARRPAPHVAEHMFRPLDLLTASAAELDALFRDADVRASVVVNATDMAGATDLTSAADGGAGRAAELLAANEGLARTLVAALEGNPGRPRLVHLGTIHEYGPGQAGVPLHEEIEPRPANAYADAKLAASRTILDAASAGRVDGVALRLVNTCGPYPTPAGFPGKLLPRLCAARQGAELSVRVVDARRDWIDVRDVAEACVLAAERPVSGRVFNIGSGIAVPMRELVAHCLAAAGLPDSGVTEEDRPGHGGVRGLGADWIQADIRLARDLLGFAPRFGLRQSLQDMWDAGVTSR